MKSLIAYFSLFAAVAVVQGQFSITTLNPTTVDNFDAFAGAGFASSPGAGQLDSDFWRVTGLSDGDGSFAGTFTTGDFARGESSGGVTTGGVYSFEAGTGNQVLGLQPTGTDFTPGTITLWLRNDTGSDVNSWDISYDIFYYNDQARGNTFNFQYSTDDSSYTAVGALDFNTPASADITPAWLSVTRTTTLNLTIAAGGSLYLQWTSDDLLGSNNRDEFGLDNISIDASSGPIPEPSTYAALVGLLSIGFVAYRRRRNA